MLTKTDAQALITDYDNALIVRVQSLLESNARNRILGCTYNCGAVPQQMCNRVVTALNAAGWTASYDLPTTTLTVA